MSERGSFGRVAAPMISRVSCGGERGISRSIVTGPRISSETRVGASPVPGLLARLPVQPRPLFGNPGVRETGPAPFRRDSLQLINTIPQASRPTTGPEFIQSLKPFTPDASQAADRLGGARGVFDHSIFSVTPPSPERARVITAQKTSEQSSRQNSRPIESPPVLFSPPARPVPERVVTVPFTLQRRETTGIVPDTTPNPINPTRLAPEIVAAQKPRETVSEKNDTGQKPIEAVRAEIGRLTVIQVTSVAISQPDRRPIISSPSVIDIKQRAVNVSAGEDASKQTFGERAQAVLTARETRKAIAQEHAYEIEEIATEIKTEDEKKKKKSLQTRLLERVKLLRQRLVMPIEDPQEVVKPLVQPQPVPDEERVRLVKTQPDALVQPASKRASVEAGVAKKTQVTAVPTITESTSDSVLPERATLPQEATEPKRNDQPESPISNEVPKLEPEKKDDFKHIVAERAKKVNLRLAREAIDSAQANEEDEISGVEVAEGIIVRRRGDEKSPLVGQDEDGAFIWRLQMIARFFLATRAIIDFYYKELVSIRPPVTIAKQGEDVTYEQVKLVTDGPKKFDINAKAA